MPSGAFQFWNVEQLKKFCSACGFSCQNKKRPKKKGGKVVGHHALRREEILAMLQEKEAGKDSIVKRTDRSVLLKALDFLFSTMAGSLLAEFSEVDLDNLDRSNN